MYTGEYFVRYIDLPTAVEGVTLPNADGTFDIYINARLSQAGREQCLRHELRHILKDHFYTDRSVAVCEVEADGSRRVRRLPDVFADAPAGTIPYFSSPAAFGSYLHAMAAQRRREGSSRP